MFTVSDRVRETQFCSRYRRRKIAGAYIQVRIEIRWTVIGGSLGGQGDRPRKQLGGGFSPPHI